MAESLGLAPKTSDSVARSGSIPDVGSGKEISAAFDMKVGQVSAATQSGTNWFVYRLVSHDAPNPADLAAQSKDIEQQLLQTKESAAFEAFHNALVDRLKKEGKLTVNSEVLNRIASSS